MMKRGKKIIFKDGCTEKVTNVLLDANLISSEEVEKAIQDGFPTCVALLESPNGKKHYSILSEEQVSVLQEKALKSFLM